MGSTPISSGENNCDHTNDLCKNGGTDQDSCGRKQARKRVSDGDEIAREQGEILSIDWTKGGNLQLMFGGGDRIDVFGPPQKLRGAAAKCFVPTC